MTSVFNPYDQRVPALISCISGLCGGEVDQVTSAWKREDAYDRARAWAQINRVAAGRERYRVLAVAALARQEAMETARRVHRTDWAFWAAACDAGAAVAAGARIGRHYDTLIAPFAEVIPPLVRPAPGMAAISLAGPYAGSDLPVKSA
jgi:hypothetical protein